MDFVDNTLIQLTAEATRSAIIDQLALRQMIDAAFDTSIVSLDGPYALDIETAELGLELAPRVTLDGAWTLPGGVPTDARFRVEGLRITQPLRVDALWRGRLIARTVPQDSRIDALTASFAPTDIDRAIIAELGALPMDPVALEAARRQRLLARLRAGMLQPAVVDDAAIDGMLARAGVASVTALLEAESSAALGTISVRYLAPNAAAPASPISLPVTVAVLVRNTPLAVSSLLAESRAIRTALAVDPAALPAPATVRRRTPVLVLWVVPITVFDDNDWPGGDRAARRSSAGELLAAQGIGLAVRTP